MWRVTVDLGDLSLEAEGPTADDPDTDPALPVLLGVRWTETLATDGALWPVGREVSTGTLTILFETAAEAEAITAATTVTVRFYSDTADTDPSTAFYGRASDPSLTVHERGVVASVVITDYLADLAELTAGTYDYPTEDHGTRLIRVFDDVGVTLQTQDQTTGAWSDFDNSPNQAWWATLAARTASATSVLAYATDVLSWAVVHSVIVVPITLERLYMDELVPVVDESTGALLGFGLRNLERDVPARAPGVLVDDAGVWRIEWPDASDPLGSYVIDANDVLFSATWTRNRALDTDRVEVVRSNQAVVQASLDDAVPITARVETTITNNADADDTLAMLLPDDRPASTWQADKFTALLDDAAPAGWYPADLRTLVTLHGIEPRHNPTDSPWYHGVVWARELVLEGRDARVDVTLLPARNVAPYAAVVSAYYNVTFTELDTAITFANIDPAIRWVDMYQVGG